MNGTSAECTGRLLVVDDDQAIQILVPAIFYRHGVKVECAGDGDTALHRLRLSRYDALIFEPMVPTGREIIGDEFVAEVLSLTPAVFDSHIALPTEESVH